MVRMHGDSLWARCELERSSDPKGSVRRSTRAVLGLLSSGFPAKMLIGTVAMAAVGGVAVGVAAGILDKPAGGTMTTEAGVRSTTSIIDGPTPVAQDVSPAEDLVDRALEYAEDVRESGECGSTVARDHSGDRSEGSLWGNSNGF